MSESYTAWRGQVARQLHIAAQRNAQLRTVELFVWLHDAQTDDFARLRTPVYDKADPMLEGERSFELTYEHAIRLMDDLWAAGIRPSHGQNPSEVIAAKDAHIADLRKMLETIMSNTND